MKKVVIWIRFDAITSKVSYIRLVQTYDCLFLNEFVKKHSNVGSDCLENCLELSRIL